MDIQFLHEKPARIIVEILKKNSGHSDEKAYASDLSSKSETTYSHTVRIVDQFEEAGLVTTEKIGRKKVLHLTEEGEQVAKAVQNLHSKLRKAGL